MPSLALKLHFHSPTPKVFKCADFTPAYSSKPLGRGLGYSFLLINYPSRFSCSRFFFLKINDNVRALIIREQTIGFTHPPIQAKFHGW